MTAPRSHDPYDDPYEDTVVPRGAVSFPLHLPIPEGFDANRPETWPKVTGRLEYIGGALWYMPPTGDDQQDTTSDVVTELNNWRRAHPDFVVATNEAGMKLGGEVRGADAAVWRKSDLPAQNTGGFRRVPPILAVEIAGKDDAIELLEAKTLWYFEHGVELVWLLVPRTRTMRVITRATEQELTLSDRVPPHPTLPGLEPRVADLFRQLS